MTPYNEELYHYGVLGMRWGVRRAQVKAAKAERKSQKKDLKWIDKNGKKIYKRTFSQVEKEASRYLNNDLAEKYKGNVYTTRGKLNGSLVSDYNKKLASLMNEAVGDLRAPSGKVVRYVAKRGEVGVHTALADAGYNMDQVKNGVWNSGRIAYKKSSVQTS